VTRALVQPLGERLGQAVGERLRHDRAVVVVVGLEPGDELVQAEPGGDRERAQVVFGGRDVVRQAPIGPRVPVGRLLPEEAEARRVVIVDNDIVALGRRGPEAVHPACS
jgi:hypothetical protein